MTIAVKRYKLTVRFIEPVLGASPSSPDVYSRFIAERIWKDKVKAKAMAAAEQSPEERQAATATATTDEVSALPPETSEEKGWTVHQRDDVGVFLMDYHIRGFLKEAGGAMTGSKKANPSAGIGSIGSKVDRFVGLIFTWENIFIEAEA